jgi:hypothetical protein
VTSSPHGALFKAAVSPEHTETMQQLPPVQATGRYRKIKGIGKSKG